MSIKYNILSGVQRRNLQATNIKITCSGSDVVISSVYFPPRFTILQAEFEEFFELLG